MPSEMIIIMINYLQIKDILSIAYLNRYLNGIIMNENLSVIAQKILTCKSEGFGLTPKQVRQIRTHFNLWLDSSSKSGAD